MNGRLLLVLLTFFVSNQTTADSAVWRISDGSSHLYLAGTLHVLSDDDYPLPEQFDKAYSDSSHIVFETDIDVMNSVDTSRKMMNHLIYSDGSTLLERLSFETTAILREYSDTVDIPLDAIEFFKPGLLLSMFTGMELQSSGMNAPGVEAYFNNLADHEGKTQGELESIETQIDILGNIGEQNPDLFVRYILSDMSRLDQLMSKLRTAWRGGDLDTIDNLMLQSDKAYPGIYQSMLVERNNNWMPKIEPMIKSQATEMIMVGAAHLGGDDGLLKLLKTKGYEVEPL